MAQSTSASPPKSHCFLGLLAAGLWLACGSHGQQAEVDGRALNIEATPISLHTDPSVDRVGQLRFHGGFVLQSADTDFGGFSGLTVDPRGEVLMAVSDRGHWLHAKVHKDSEGKLLGLQDARIGPLLDLDGSPVEGQHRRDAEEILDLPEGYLVTFEQNHRAFYYEAQGGAPPKGLPQALAHPEQVAEGHDNQGMEAATRLQDGRLLILAEDLRHETDDLVGWVGHPDEGWQPLTLAPTEDLQPTGATTLPSGDVLLLERSYVKGRGNVLRISRLPQESIAPGQRLLSEELAVLRPPFTVDNLEAIAAHAGPEGEIYVDLLSDDNFSDRQRTLWLRFRWEPGP